MEEKPFGVRVVIERPETSKRFWAIPIIGIAIKGIILIPHAILLYIMLLVVSILQLILWIPVLFGGGYPDWGFRVVAGTIRAYTRIYGYLLGLTDVYPPFQYVIEEAEAATPYPLQVELVRPPNSGRFWAIPLLGFIVKEIILIPHLVLVYILGIVIEVLQLVLWVPVLFSGRYPDWGLNVVGGTLQWSARVQAYMFGLTDQYPPFSLDVERSGSVSTAGAS